jgi:hypothetical protein
MEHFRKYSKLGQGRQYATLAIKIYLTGHPFGKFILKKVKDLNSNIYQ